MKQIQLIIINLTMILFCSCNKQNEFYVKKLNDTIIIDGIIDEIWDSIPYNYISYVTRGEILIDDSLDLSARFKTLWNDSNIYFLFDIIDNIPTSFNSEYGFDNVAAWDNDFIQVYFSFSDSKEYTPYKDCFRYGYIYEKGILYGDFVHNYGIATGLKTTDIGYIVEMQLPWISMNQKKLSPNKVFKMNISISDNDSKYKETGIFDERESSIRWSGKDIPPHKYTNGYKQIRLIK